MSHPRNNPDVVKECAWSASGWPSAQRGSAGRSPGRQRFDRSGILSIDDSGAEFDNNVVCDLLEADNGATEIDGFPSFISVGIAHIRENGAASFDKAGILKIEDKGAASSQARYV